MTSEFERNLEKYAEVTVKVALNLQPGQRLLIGKPYLGNLGTPIELAPLVRLIVAKAYQAGARLVDVLWNDDQLRLIRLKYAPRDTLDEFPFWRTDAAVEIAEAGDASLLIYAEDPDLLINQDEDLLTTIRQTALKYSKPFSDLQSKNALNWALITAPVEGWVDKVLPEVPPADREAKMWDMIFEICRIKQPDPVSAWKAHINELVARRDYLNQKQYKTLRFTGSGTDLTVGLPERHLWAAARMTAQNGIDFTANIPTEEVFTIPHLAKTEGIVSSTKPLSYGGSLIDDFQLSFSEGRIVEASAKVGETSLQQYLNMDEGARRLGEVALVPHSSPISQLGTLFYNTLIDENAASHFALGRAYRFNIEGGERLSDEEFAAAGGNKSLIHIDFMVGSDELDVDGYTSDGGIEPVFRDGEWAFEVEIKG
jgi:aminopeptidase